MSAERRTTRARGWTLGVVLTVTVGYASVLQVQANYARNEAVASARELADPVVDLCRHDPIARRLLGDDACRRAAEVVAPTSASSPSSVVRLVGLGVLSLLTSRDDG